MLRDIEVSDDFIEYTSFASPIDLYTAKSRVARYIKCWGAGTLNVKMAGSGGNTRALTVADGDEVTGQFTSIQSVSGITRVRVGWN